MAVDSKPDSRTRTFLSALIGIVVAVVTQIAISGAYVFIVYLFFRRAHGEITVGQYIDLIADTPLKVFNSAPLVAIDLGYYIFVGWASYCVAARCARTISKRDAGLFIVFGVAIITVLLDVLEFSGWNADEILSFCEDILTAGAMLITWRRWSPRA